MITLDLSILNQKGTPMFFSDLTANRPAAGIVGRIFIATDSPYGIFRDTGSSWDLVSGSSIINPVTGTGTTNFIPKWTSSSVLGNSIISASNTLITNNFGTSSLFLGQSGSTRFGYSANSVTLAFSTGLPLLLGTYDGQNCSLGTNNNENLRISVSGNTIIQNGGIFVDSGHRLQVYGDTLLKGSGNNSGTNALLVQNSAGSNLLRVFNSGFIGIGDSSSRPLIYTGSPGSPNPSSPLLFFGLNSYTTPTNGENLLTLVSNVISTTTGTSTQTGIIGTFAPTSGTHNHVIFGIGNTINQTGGANGITRGVYVSPILTAAADWRSIEWSNNSGWGLYGAGTALNYLGGTLGIKTTSPYAPSTFSLDVNGGLLVKNTAGTTAQITLINADPSLGGNNGFLVASVGGTSGGSYVDFQGYYGTSIVGSTALRLNPAGGAVIVNSTTNSGEQFQLTGSIRVNGQTSATSGGVSGQHLIINCDGVQYKIELRNP